MTINLEAYKKLGDREKGLYLLEHGDRQVNIYSGQHAAYWRADAKGYSADIKGAGVYTLSDAIYRTLHCGPEKRIKFHYISDVVDLPPVKVFEHDELFENIKVRFDKNSGNRRGDNDGGWR